MTTTWNPSDKSTNTILTDSNHHAQNGTTGSNSGARGTTSHDSGKWYLEYSDNVLSGFHSRRGFATAAQDLTDYSAAHMFGVTEGGGGDGSGGGISAVAGVTVQLAVDIDAGRYWYRKAGDSLWQGGGGSAVALGTGGADYTGSVAAGTAIFPAFVSFSNSGQLGATTLNCGDRPFASAVPAGWQAWDDDPTNTHAWNPSDKSTAITLADSNHSATNTTTGGNAGVRAGTSHNTGKWYLEFSNNVASGFHQRRGFATAAQDLTDYSNAHMFGCVEGGGGDGSGNGTSSVVGEILQMAIDIDAGLYWFKLVGEANWHNASGTPAAIGTFGIDYTSWIPAATTIYPAFVTFSNSGQLGSTTINLGDRAFAEAPPVGYSAWDAGSTGATAPGATMTVTASLSRPGTTPARTVTVTASVTWSGIAGNASGVVMSRTISLIAGEAGESVAVDGSRIFEFSAAITDAGSYINADFDSIYSIGDRTENGIAHAGIYGHPGPIFGSVDQLYDGNFSFPTGDGLTYNGGSPLPNWAHWITFSYADGYTAWGVDIRGMRLRGHDAVTNTDFFQIQGGVDVGLTIPESYANEFDFYNPGQSSTTDAYGQHVTEYHFTPKYSIPWPHYEFFMRTANTTTQTYAQEVEFQVAHSSLDGGDRRPGIAPPAKSVVATLSSDWTVASGSHPFQDACFDGDNYFGNDGSGHTWNSSRFGAGGSGTSDMTTPGAYLQFVFPRKVCILRMVFQMSLGDKEVFSAGNPTKYGKWHWEISRNSGTTWFPVGPVWWFQEGGYYMLAPHVALPPGTDQGAGAFAFPRNDSTGVPVDGVTHWRMVLDAAAPLAKFGASSGVYQIMFHLQDLSEIGLGLTGAFTDDSDGVLPTLTIVNGNPYRVALTDGDSDVLTGTLTITPNLHLTGAFSDGDSDQLDGYGSFFPSTVVQTIINSKG